VVDLTGNFFDGTCSWSTQVFTAENSGPVNKVRVYAFASGGPNPIRYRLRTGGTPGAGSLLDSLDVTVPGVIGWMDLVFPSHPVLTTGLTYQLEINSDQSATHCTRVYYSGIPYA
jgi:hypothetical protein